MPTIKHQNFKNDLDLLEENIKRHYKVDKDQYNDNELIGHYHVLFDLTFKLFDRIEDCMEELYGENRESGDFKL